MSGYTACSPVYQGIILLILTVRAELFHLSGRIAGYSTCPTVCRDYTPLSDQSVTYFPWPTYSVYIDLLPISTTYYTQDTYSFFLDKFQIFPVCVPLPATNKKGNINVTCATCIDPSRVRALHSFRTRKPIHFYFEKGEEKTIPFTVNIKKKKKKRRRTEVVRDVDYFLRDTKICSRTWHYCRGIMVGKISHIFFFFLLISLYTFINRKKRKRKKGYYFYVFLIVMEAMCNVEEECSK